MTSATDTATLVSELTNLLGASAVFWPNGKSPQLDDLYEVYLWAETLSVAKSEGWQVDLVNGGLHKNEFTFRKAPGLLSSTRPYTYATLRNGQRSGELHIGVRVRGVSRTLHEFDVVAFDSQQIAAVRQAHSEPGAPAVRFHIEAKFHRSDLSLGVGRSIVGLGLDCPGIEPFLVSRATGSPSLRPFIKYFKGHYVDRMFPGDTGAGYFATCVRAALNRWR